MTFREMSVEDLEQVVEIEKALFSDPWTKEGFFTFLTKENTMFFVVEEKMTVPYSFAPAHVNKQRAAAVAALGEIYYSQGKTETAMEHVPDYLRVSQAERERAEREAAKADGNS